MKNIRYVGKEVKEFSNLLSRQIEISVSESGLTLVQGRLLNYIFRSSIKAPVYQKDLEKEFNIRRSSATELLQKIESKGLIRRIEDKNDKRVKIIEVTEEGRIRNKKVYKHLCDFESKIKKDVSEEELNLFYKVLDKMKKNIGDEKEDI